MVSSINFKIIYENEKGIQRAMCRALQTSKVEVASGTRPQTLRVQGCCSALEWVEASPGVKGMLNTRLRPGFKVLKAHTKGQHDANWHVRPE